MSGSIPVPLGARPVPITGDVSRLAPDVRRRRRDFPVAIVAMPWALPTRPSAQVGLLAAIARSHGFPVTPVSAFLDLGARLGLDTYVALAHATRPQIGDWLFGRAAFGAENPDVDEALLDVLDTDLEPALAAALGSDHRRALREIRDEVAPALIDGLLEEIDWAAHRVVGFTSTFQQSVASLALAGALKRRWPHLRILFGGANCDGPMGRELMRGMTVVDLLLAGEADRSFPDLLARLADLDGDPSPPADRASRSLDRVPGLLWRDEDGEVREGPPPVPTEDLDELPVPDYDEYFERSDRLRRGGASPTVIDIPFESARGCWWGEKLTCTFCGLNGSTMAFRSKSPDRVLDELAELTRRHGHFSLFATDNILDLGYLDAVMDRLAVDGTGYELFYEVKATLDRQAMGRLRAAGVTSIQPGIDSLSPNVLRHMRKGMRVLQGVNLLRWARFYGVEVFWNILWGIAGETPEDYVAMARTIGLLHHLAPPIGLTRIDIDRFSPYFEAPGEFPTHTPLRPDAGYALAYPATVDPRAIAYRFDGELVGSVADADVAPTVAAAATWTAAWARAPRPTLEHRWAPGVLRVGDRRSALASCVHEFGDPHAALYRAANDGPRTESGLATDLDLPIEAVREALGELERRGLVLRDGPQVLALAVPAGGAR